MSYIIKGTDDKPILHQGKEIHAMDYVGVVKGVDVEKRVLKITGTDETRDRDGDIIKMSGWMIENYLKNPVFLWAHDYRSVPLAAALKVVKRRNPASMEFQLRFPTEGLYPFADMILSLYSEGIINASSVGFIPFKWEDLTDEEKQDMAPLAEIFGGRKFIKQELLELSGCAVPSNPNALQNALKSFGEQQELQVDAEKVMSYLLKGTPQDVMEVKEDDVLEELRLGKCDFEDETDPKVHQVPEDIIKEVEGEDISVEEVTKPYPNEHACRLKEPGEFEKFRRGKRKHDGKEYSIIFGKKKDSDSWAEQAYRYNKETWTAAEAKGHCGDHNGSFEGASDSSQEDLLPDYNIRMTPEANIQFEKTDYGKIIFYGEYSDESGIVINNIASQMPEEEAERFHREMLSQEFGVDLSEGDFCIQETRWVKDVPESKTVVRYLAFTDGTLKMIKEEAHDLKDLEPEGKVGSVLGRKNKALFTKARDILDEILRAQEEPDETGADVTTKDLQAELEKIKIIVNDINESLGG